METFQTIIEIIGIISFSVSGAITAIRRNLDVFGVVILALITSYGGGIMRDLILGVSPPAILNQPIYIIITILTAIIVFFPFIRKFFCLNRKVYEIIMLIADSLGIAVFAMVGLRTAESLYPHQYTLIILVGSISSLGGGIMRDITVGHTPYIFVKHFYACAVIVGVIVAMILWQFWNELGSMIVGAVVIITLRILAAKFKWGLPHAHDRFLPDEKIEKKTSESEN
jgi:uncharacterized membrane protein YeiH